MKFFLFFVQFFMVLMQGYSQPLKTIHESKGIKFEKGLSWEQIKAKAMVENKYIFMDLYATWCGPCKKMDKEVYTNDTLGIFMNEKFISVKVQMDSSTKDSREVKSWYADAQAIGDQYKIEGYPSFLFFSPDGRLAFKDLGYKNYQDLVKVAEKALDPQSLLYYVRFEEYKKGTRDYTIMSDLALFTKQVIGDDTLAKQIGEDYINHLRGDNLLTTDNILLVLNVIRNRRLADSLAKKYKATYLDKLTEEELCTKENLQFIDIFNSLINSKDNFFHLFYYQPEKVDQIKGSEGWAHFLVAETIKREELENKLWVGGKAVFDHLNWDSLQSLIKEKYSRIDPQLLILDYQVKYYRRLQNWIAWAQCLDKKTKTYPINPGDGFWELNLPAWDAFLNCNDEKVLSIALEWSDLSVKVDQPNPNFQCFDTKANLLYKLGRTEQAIEIEDKAIEIALALSKKEGTNFKYLMNQVNGYKGVIRKMRKREPTYLDEGAIWTSNTITKISAPPVMKPAISSSAFDTWLFVDEAVNISGDGKYIIYKIRENYNTAGTLIIQEINGRWEKELSNVSDATFTEDSRKVVCLKSKDSLCLVNLSDSSVEFLPGINSFKLFSQNKMEWLAYQLSSEENKLVLVNLKNGQKKFFPGVSEYVVSENGNILVLKTEEKKGNDASQMLYWVNLTNSFGKMIWKGFKAGSLVLDAKGSQLAFVVEDKIDSQSGKAIWYYKAETEKASQLVNNHFDGVFDDLELQGISRFSKDGNSLFILLKEKVIPKLKSGIVELDIWNYLDNKLQPHQSMEPYAAIINLNDHHIQRLQYKGETVVMLSKTISDEYVLVNGTKGDPEEMKWSIASEPVYFLVSTKDGERKPLGLNPVMASPDNKFIVGYKYKYGNSQNRELCIYEIATGTITNVSSLIPAPTYINEYSLVRTKGLRPVAFMSDMPALLVYDYFDIWQINLNAIKTPVNLTNGFGRKNNFRFRLANESDFIYSGKTVNKNEKILLHVFNLKNKQEGFCYLHVGLQNYFEHLSLGPYKYYDEKDNWYFRKAKNTDVYLVKRSNATESVNYYWTKDFQNYNALTNIHPEKDYNWMTTNLISFKTLDGQINEAVIYKPENFNPKKKYPVILHYYEQKSDKLNEYQKIFGNDAMDFSIAWFVSHGYIVVTPDIHYKEGRNGQSALNAVVGVANYLSNFSWVDASKIGLDGESFGGLETNYIVTHTNRFAAAVSSSGLVDLISDYGSVWGSGNSKQGYYENRQGRMGSTLWERPDLYIENSPIFRADKIATPILIVANKEDANVSFTQGLELFLALRREGKKTWMLQYDNQTHGLDGKAFVDFTIRSQQFFDHYLKDSACPRWMLYGIPAKDKGIDDGLELVREKDTNGKWLTPQEGGLLTDEEKKKVEALKKRKPVTVTIE